MGFTIVDGSNGNSANISPTGNRLNVSARVADRIFYISRDNGDAYTTTSIDTPSAGEYNFYFKNTSAVQKFYVSTITFGCSSNAIFKIAKVTGTAGGAGSIPINNLNLISGNVADAIVNGNGAITGLTENGLIETISVMSNDSQVINFKDAFILGTNNSFAVETDSISGGTVHITVRGFFDIE